MGRPLTGKFPVETTSNSLNDIQQQYTFLKGTLVGKNSFIRFIYQVPVIRGLRESSIETCVLIMMEPH